MKQVFYKIIYTEKINWILRQINKFFAPILPKKIKISPSGIIKVKNEQGKVLTIKTNQTSYLTKLIFWEGGYRHFEYTDIFIRLIKKINSFYDIGANIGYYSLLAAMENEKIKVVGFEPAQGPLFYFKENIRINGFTNIKIEPIALSHKEGKIEFHEIQNNKYTYLKFNLAGESSTCKLAENRFYRKNIVKTTTLDVYTSSKNEKNIDLIKMDTEGSENLILEKSARVLKEMKPIIICETLFNRIEPELERIMKLHGYEFYNHTKEGLVKQKSIVRQYDNGVSNCFFVHPDKFNLIEEFVLI